MLISSVNLDSVVSSIPQINDKEREILRELFFSANQEYVGSRFGVRQSSVKWIFTKSKRYVAALEPKAPEKWSVVYGILLLLEKNLRKRVFS
jgi:hypothetical protein